MARTTATPKPTTIPAREVVLVIQWKRTYPSRFTVPGKKGLVLKPGSNEITEEQLPLLEVHRDTLRTLEAEGHLALEQPKARPTTSPPRAPVMPAHTPDDDELAELEELRSRIARGSSDPESPASSAEADVKDDAGGSKPTLAELPAWSPSSTYEELKAAARARGCAVPANIPKAKLLEDLEKHDDALLLAEADVKDDAEA